MKEIIVKFKNGRIESFKTTDSGSNITLGAICSSFFERNMIHECCNLNNWTDGSLSKTNVFSYFGATVLSEKKLDCRTKYSKSLKPFHIQYLVDYGTCNS